jgi:hypothetical protein
MADGDQGGDNLDWGKLLSALIGLGGSGMALINGLGTQDDLNKLYNQLQAMGVKLSNPAQLAQLMKQLYQPMSQELRDAIGRDVYGQLAMHGTTEGAAADRAVASAFTNVEQQLMQQAFQNLFQGQQQGANALKFIPGTNQGGASNVALGSALGSIGPLVKGLAEALGLTQNDTQKLLTALGGGDRLTNPTIGTGTSQDPFAPSNTMREPWDDPSNPYYFPDSSLYSGYDYGGAFTGVDTGAF